MEYEIEGNVGMWDTGGKINLEKRQKEVGSGKKKIQKSGIWQISNQMCHPFLPMAFNHIFYKSLMTTVEWP